MDACLSPGSPVVRLAREEALIKDLLALWNLVAAFGWNLATPVFEQQSKRFVMLKCQRLASHGWRPIGRFDQLPLR
jgi:hypothetical protein